MAEGRRYSEEEVRAILERALRQESASSGGIAHDDLVAAAGEIGVSRADLERAAREISETRGQTEAKARIIAARRAAFSAHLYAFLGVNAFLFAINWLTSPGFFWFLFPLLGWGLGLFFHARAAFSKEVSERSIARHLERGERDKRRTEKKVAAERRHHEKRERKERLEKGAAELGAAVEEGVGVLLSKVAEEIRRKTDASLPSQVRFDPNDGQRVRVETPFAEKPDEKSQADRAREEALAETEVDDGRGQADRLRARR